MSEQFLFDIQIISQIFFSSMKTNPNY